MGSRYPDGTCFVCFRALGYVEMLIAVLATVIIFMGILILVLVAGYREQLRTIRMKANINAGLWAEAEAKAHDAEIRLAKVDGALQERIKVYQDMQNLAWRAIQAAGEANSVTKELEREWNTEGNSDEVLNATEIDN